MNKPESNEAEKRASGSLEQTPTAQIQGRILLLKYLEDRLCMSSSQVNEFWWLASNYPSASKALDFIESVVMSNDPSSATGGRE